MAQCFSLFSYSLILITILLAIFSSIPLSSSTPFVVFHGVSMACFDPGSMYYTLTLSTMTRIRGHCVEVGNGMADTWMMSITNQADEACRKVKGMPELSSGYNIVGLSQGNMVGRGVIEMCDGPPVKKFMSVGGPNAGHSSTMPCGKLPWCSLMGRYYGIGVYSPFVQNHMGPAGYIKIPTAIPTYLRSSIFLPKLNNEVEDGESAIRKKRFAGMDQLVLVLFQFDTIILPQLSSWFGYYPNGDFSRPVPMQQTDVYQKDLFGLQTLDKAGKIKFFKVPGAHIVITVPDMQRCIAAFLT